MPKTYCGLETVFFLGSGSVLFFAGIAATYEHRHLHFQNDRVQYGMQHLPAALLSAAVVTLLAAWLLVVLSRKMNLEDQPSSYYLGAIVVVFCVFWLPPLLAGGFTHDDWKLLAAAKIRTTIVSHPWYAWHTLDAVDGNFRPLGTVLFFSFAAKYAGLHPLFFLAGNFVLNLLACLIAFAIVRELGYSKLAATAAAMLYLSRDMTYIENAWAAAISDALAIPLCGLAILAVLKAIKHSGALAALDHLLAYACFGAALLSKQSAFAVPGIIALLLFMRPGVSPPLPFKRRLSSALIALALYGAFAGLVFLHARALLHQRTPYPLSLNLHSVLGSLCYICWFFADIDLLGKVKFAIFIPAGLGLAALIGFGLLLRRSTSLLGDRRKDVWFALLAAAASLCVMLPLGDRVSPYYGAMFAFWLSIAFGICLTRYASMPAQTAPARISCFLFLLLLTTGFLGIRLKQTGLISPGGYIWGTFNMDLERAEYNALANALAHHPTADTLGLVIAARAHSPDPAMVFLMAPKIKRIVVYDSDRQSYFVNNSDGSKPSDGYDSLADAQAFQWTIPAPAPHALKLIASGNSVWIRFSNEGTKALSSAPGSTP